MLDTQEVSQALLTNQLKARNPNGNEKLTMAQRVGNLKLK